MTPSPVPELLRGVWKRRWIKHQNGSFDDTSVVVWLQFEHRMVDVRLSADRAALADRGSLEGCDLGDLLQLAEGDSSSGTTACTPVLEDADGLRNARAEWSNVGGIAFQPESLFPEPHPWRIGDELDVAV